MEVVENEQIEYESDQDAGRPTRPFWCSANAVFDQAASNVLR
jgi:hypothetical protein